MAELNFGLLNPPGSQSIGNAFVTGMDQARASQMQDMQMQRGQRQDQMAELQLRKAQATETKLNQFYESIAANGGPRTPIEIEDKMIGSGIPNVSQQGLAARSARLQVEEGRKLSGEINTMTQLGIPRTPEGYAAFRASQQPRKLLSDEEFEQQLRLRQEGRPPPTTKLLTPEELAQQVQLRQAGRPPQATKLLTPEELAQQVQLRQAGRPPQAPAMKPLTEGQTIKLRTDVGKDYKNASTALAQMDDVLTSAALVRTAPGLGAATGYTGMLPSFTGGAAAQAETRLANLRGKITAAAKAAASMGGAIGPIATAEWKILSDQIAALNEVKGKGPLLEQISGLETQMIGAAERIRDAYEKTRGEDFERFPQFANLPPPKSAIKPKTPTAPGTPAAAQGTGGFTYLGKESSK